MIKSGHRPVRRRLRGAVAVLAIVLAVLAFEAGLHAAHHLDDESAAAACAVASVTGHLAGVTDVAVPDGAALSSGEPLVAEPRPVEVLQPFAPRPGRSPPFLA